MSLKNINAFCKTLPKSNWDIIREENEVIKAYDNFYNKITATAELSFPLKLVKTTKVKKVPWMTTSFIKSKKLKINYLIKKLKLQLWKT